MRKSAGMFLALVACLVGHAGLVSAAPTVTFNAKDVPITGFPHTGNILGGGAAAETELHISGTEYWGYPPPLTGLNLFLPAGTKINPGFNTCPTNTITVEHEPLKCPRSSQAGPVGTAEAFVVFGSERVPETPSLEPFFTPSRSRHLRQWAHPASIEIGSTGVYTEPTGEEGFGPELSSTLPLIETVPGAPDGSLTSIELKIGAAFKRGNKAFYFSTLPQNCPAGGFVFKAELTFAALRGLTQQTVTSIDKTPCPSRRIAEAPPVETSLPRHRRGRDRTFQRSLPEPSSLHDPRHSDQRLGLPPCRGRRQRPPGERRERAAHQRTGRSARPTQRALHGANHRHHYQRTPNHGHTLLPHVRAQTPTSQGEPAPLAVALA